MNEISVTLPDGYFLQIEPAEQPSDDPSLYHIIRPQSFDKLGPVVKPILTEMDKLGIDKLERATLKSSKDVHGLKNVGRHTSGGIIFQLEN